MDVTVYVLSDYPSDVKAEGQAISEQMRSNAEHAKTVALTLTDAGIRPTGDASVDATTAAMVMKRASFSLTSYFRANAELAGLGALTGLAIVGIFDPTPVSDGAAAVVALAMMRYGWGYLADAGLSAVSAVPYVGDAIGKPLLAGRLAARAGNLMSVVNGYKGARQSVRAFYRAATTGERHLDDLIRGVSALDDAPYKSMAALKRYMQKRGVEVIDGQEGAKLLDKLGRKNAAAMFVVAREAEGAPIVTGLLFRGEPSRAVVHHELWHRNDFLRNYQGNWNRWTGATIAERELYVQQRMVGMGLAAPGGAQAARAQRRWGEYSPQEQLSQTAYAGKFQLESLLEMMTQMSAALGK
jgi:hypothetical protein